MVGGVCLTDSSWTRQKLKPVHSVFPAMNTGNVQKLLGLWPGDGMHCDQQNLKPNPAPANPAQPPRPRCPPVCLLPLNPPQLRIPSHRSPSSHRQPPRATAVKGAPPAVWDQTAQSRLRLRHSTSQFHPECILAIPRLALQRQSSQREFICHPLARSRRHHLVSQWSFDPG